MKLKLKPLVVSLFLCGLVIDPGIAATTLEQEKINQLERQLQSLQREVNAIRNRSRMIQFQSQPQPRPSSTQPGASLPKKPATNVQPPDVSPAGTPLNPTHANPNNPNLREADETSGSHLQAIESTVKSGQQEAEIYQPAISGPSALPKTGMQYFPFDINVPGQSFVTTGPYIGVPLQYSGSNLIINNPNINEDVSLLTLRKNINKRLIDLGLKPEDEHSHLLLSGIVEGQYAFRNIGGDRSSSDIDLTSAGIDAYILTPSTWVSGLISLSYDNSIGARTGSFSNFSRVQNSRVFINKAFVVVGDFLKSPFYGTIGQMYVPFGVYSSTMISSPLTKLMARTQARAVLVGVQQQCPNAFYGSVYAFKGDTHVNKSRNVKNGGLNLGYKFNYKKLSGDFGGGIIANIADSQGMQNNGLSVVPLTFPLPPFYFTGFGGVSGSGSEFIVHRVPAYNVRGLISFGNTIDFLAECVVATKKFSPLDMTMNNHGARPRALNVELAYTFQKTNNPTSISLGYGKAEDALALQLPSNRYSVVFNTSIWRNTLQSIEFRHDIGYAPSNTATGSGLPVPTPSGKSDNILIAQFDIYF